MKNIRSICEALSVVLFSLCISACDVITSTGISVQSTIVGTANSSPSIARIGEELTFTIGGGITSSSTVSINGKEYYPVVHYLLDGVEVVVSTEKDMPFKASYLVKDLSIGDHVLSVEMTGSNKNVTYINMVGTSTITIE